MAQIIQDNIKFNGYDLFQRFNLMNVHITQSTERLFGLKRTMEMQDGINNPIFIKNKDERNTFPIELCKIVNGKPTSITERELEEVGRILFQNKIGLLEAGGRLYYGCFTGSTSWFNGAMQGYLNLTFEMATPYCYTPIYINNVNVNGTKIIEVFNKSSVSDDIYIDIDIQQLGINNEVIEIKNKTNGNYMKFNGISNGEVINVLGQDVKEVFSKTNKDKNVFKDLEYNDFINLKYGKNIIEIKGKCKISIKYQLPLIIR